MGQVSEFSFFVARDRAVVHPARPRCCVSFTVDDLMSVGHGDTLSAAAESAVSEYRAAAPEHGKALPEGVSSFLSEVSLWDR